MKIYPFLALPFIFLLTVGQIAYAQNRPNQGIGDILGDIFKGNQNGQDQYPNQTMIDNIPVNVRVEVGPSGLPENASLIISAFAPPAPNVRRSSPLLIGETRLLLAGLTSPLELVIAAPATVTKEIDYARIEAKIINAGGDIIFKSREQGEYRGRDIPVITLAPTDAYVPVPLPQTPTNPTTETVNGIVNLDNSNQNFRGANLIVNLIEEGLAGGQNPIILGTSKQSIDQKAGPYAFTFEKTQARNPETPLVFDAWIQDWAGRKTHTLPYPMLYNGPDLSYRLKLTPTNSQTPPTPQSIGQFIKGEARFNAFKGLPAGSVLIAELQEKPNSARRPSNLATTNVKLDGLSGNIPFTLDLLDQRIDPSYFDAVIRIRIEDKNGRVFFSNPGGTPLKYGFNAVDLVAAPNY